MMPHTEETIYCILCTKTGRRYIGRTACYETRVKDHFCALRSGRHKNELMQSDYNRFGESAFIAEPLYTGKCGRTYKEREYMILFDTGNKEHGYNYKDPVFMHYNREPTRYAGRW